MAESIYQKFGVSEVVNAVGYATRVGGSWPTERVIQAMADAQRGFIEIDDLQAAASECIARHTGAEAGIVTCGAGAALTLAAAACLAGNDPDLMELLPDTATLPHNRIIYPRPETFDYDHPVRLSGAQCDLISYDAPNILELIEAAITPQTAAIGYVWKRKGQVSVEAVAGLAHRHNLPLIVDAALSLPPTEHLCIFIEQGADLIAISGGKHLGGPQASGLLFGRRDLIRSAWLQMVDMDVREKTWSLHHWIAEGFITRAPRHGIGRSMKVSKEAIVGLLTALEDYAKRDHAAELRVWQQRVSELSTLLQAIDGLEVESLFPAPNGQPFPVVRVRLPGGMAPLIQELRTFNPKVIVAEDEDNPEVAWLFPMQLRDGQVRYIAATFQQAMLNLNRKSAKRTN